MGYANTTGQLKRSFCSTQVAVAPHYGVRLHYKDRVITIYFPTQVTVVQNATFMESSAKRVL